jgi:hypothetical protein
MKSGRWGTRLLIASQWVAILGGVRILGSVEHPAGQRVSPVDVLRYGPLAATFLLVGTAMASWAWWRHRGRPYGPLTMIGMHALVWSAYGSLWAAEGNVHHGVILPAAAAIAEAYGRLKHADDTARAEAVADEVTAGAVSAVYLWAVASKLLMAGTSWLHTTDIPLLIFERALARQSALGMWFATSPWIPIAGLGVLLVELAGGAFLITSLRTPLALALCLMHAGIGLTLGYPYLEWCLVLAGVALRTRTRQP